MVKSGTRDIGWEAKKLKLNYAGQMAGGRKLEWNYQRMDTLG